MKSSITLLFIVFVIPFFGAAQALQSPEKYLGYALGTRYTNHYKVVAYFDYVAKNASSTVKYTRYGTTNEGRELTLAYISSAENLANLDNIRTSNLKRTHIINGTPNGDVAIVWLSYNVHGNEPSSSEAAMQTLYELVTQHTNDWLKNTVVIIDPCLNPDGRDRYVNWYNGVVGNKPNANPISREHLEPWPSGRVNHYYYDLNRDWAWQTQVETQQRIKVYNQWLPQIHVDFHEQGYNEPYYFAPAAEPMHEVITPWQKDFQTVIGRNHAKYFDANGWYYFTKERFDLFYPSYGDTYPTYNGSIGMTYEQGGHSRGGLAVQIDNGDTLTLVDRVAHHHTTGISTVEVASQNAAALLTNFSKYFDNSINAIGSNYKTYVLTSNTESKLTALTNLLAKNEINFTPINKIVGSGINYATAKSEAITLDKYSIAISAFQPKSLLAKVLLEPTSKLNDTATYDITAWSLPYAYGLKAYASTEKLAIEAFNNTNTNNQLPNTNYAYFVPYHSINDATILAQLLQQNVKVYINEKEITTQKQVFDKGTLLIPKKDNLQKWEKVKSILQPISASVTAIATGFADKGPDMGSPDIKYISAPKIACITGDDAGPNASGEIWHFFEQQINYPVTMLDAGGLKVSNLKNFDVIIIPDGYYKLLSEKNSTDDLKNWVRQGGRLILLEGAANQIATGDWGVKLKKEEEKKEEDKKKNEYENLKVYSNRDRDEIPTYIPGAIYEVALDNSHPLAFGYGNTYYTLKQNSDFLEFSKNAWNVGVIKKNKKTSGFAGFKVTEKLNDGAVLTVQEMGRGQIIYFIDNPMFRSFWYNGKLLFFNAAFIVGNNAIRL